MFVDSLNAPIRQGATLSYPVRKGARMWLESGKVEGVELDGDGLVALVRKGNGRLVRFRSFNRSVVTQ